MTKEICFYLNYFFIKTDIEFLKNGGSSPH
jgi:hypothetical protein